MTCSVKHLVGIPKAVGVALILAGYLACIAAAAAGQRSLEVIDLSSTSTADEAGKARAAFTKGDAIVRMIGGSPADFKRLVGARLADSKALSESSQSAKAGSRTQLKLQAVAAYKEKNGIERSVLSFAPETTKRNGDGWRKHLDDWIQNEQTKASSGVGDPTPPAKAWTLLYETTVQGSSNYGNYEQNTIEVYRLNSTTATDYYMVFTQPEVIPAWTGTCNGYDECGWHTMSRSFSHAASPSNGLIDHGPTGTVADGSVGFSIGVSFDPGAEFSTEWSQPQVSTVDNSSSTAAMWNETFKMFSNINPCNPPGGAGSVPGTSSGTFTSEQGSIFEVPAGTTSISFPITAVANWCDYYPYINGSEPFGFNHDSLNLAVTLSVGAPVLQALTKNLTIPANGTALLPVTAYIPGSDQGLPWTITSNQLWLTVPSSGPFTTGQVIPVTVASNQADGTGGTLSINTSPPFAAPSVRTGPIQVNVTVGPSKASPLAGILLFGGVSPDEKTFFGAQFYDLVSEEVFPLTPQLPTRFNSTATLLNTGSILIAGGTTNFNDFSSATATAELFNPASLTFSYTGTLTTARSGHAATLLSDGKVLIVGGIDADGNELNSAELYDPATGTFSSAGTLQTPRYFPHASLISGPGKPTQVVVYGGSTTTSVEGYGWELWDEAKNGFIASGTMPAPAVGIPQPVAFPFADGVLDLVGGVGADGNYTAQEQLLTLNGPSFELGDKLQVPRVSHTLTALPNGAGLLVTGGFTSPTDPAPNASAEIRNADGWNLLSGTAACPGSPGCMLAARAGHTATLLPDGTVFVVGGNTIGLEASGPDTEFYDPASKTFTKGPSIGARIGHTATLVVTTATSLIATPLASKFGQTVNLQTTVTSGSGTPTGPVHFLDGSTELGSAELMNGQASINVSTLSVGSHELTAVYSGDGISMGSTSPVVRQIVSGSTTTTVLSVSPNPSQSGSAVTMTATVTATSGTATGVVVFSDGGKQIASADLANGSATAQVSDLSVGQHPITATYSGKGNTQGSTSAAVTQTVTAVKISTTTTLSSSNNPSTSGQSVTFQAQVKPVSGSGVPTGTVNFLDGSTVLGSANLISGTASISTSSLAVGTHAIVGAYLGDSNFSISNSSVLTQTVSSTGGGKVTPTVDLTVNGSTSSTVSAGDTVTFVARIQAASGYPWPTGSITISDSTDGSVQYGSANITKDPNSNDGLATITNSGIAAGNYTLVATYGGDNEGKYYNGARSNTVSLTIKPSVGGPPPERSLAISATAGARDGALMPVSLTVTNSGTVPASGITLNQVALRTLTGTGQARLFAPTLPVSMGNLSPGASTIITLELLVPATIQQLALTENGTLQGAGKVYQFSLGQVIFP